MWTHIHGFCPTRFAVYTRNHGPDPLESTSNYIWNSQVSAALLPTLAAAEVLLRNAVDKVMIGRHGEMWFDLADLLLEPELLTLKKAKGGAKKKENRRGRPTNHDDIAVELGFRFWANLLMRDYSRKIWNHLLIDNAFPKLPANLGDRRQLLRGIMSDACDIRNRVCHGERVIHLADLSRRQADVLKAISWISPTYAKIIRATDTFPKVWSDGLEECRTCLLGMCPALTKPDDPKDDADAEAKQNAVDANPQQSIK